MSAYVIWMDLDEAKIFSLNKESDVAVHLKRKHHPHHSHHPKDGMPASENPYYESLAMALVDAGEILLLGPGVAKTQFNHFLTQHSHLKVAKKVVGIQNSDHPSDGQILAAARKFFHAKAQLDGTLARSLPQEK